MSETVREQLPAMTRLRLKIVRGSLHMLEQQMRLSWDQLEPLGLPHPEVIAAWRCSVEARYETTENIPEPDKVRVRTMGETPVLAAEPVPEVSPS